MKRSLFALAVVGALASACGGSTNRVSDAHHAVLSYWTDIQHGKIDAAYALLTPGNQSDITRANFRQSMFQFLQQTNGVTPFVGKAQVVGDCALVPVNITYAASGTTTKAFQHLFWVDSGWRISEADGALNQHPGKLTCPTGT